MTSEVENTDDNESFPRILLEKFFFALYQLRFVVVIGLLAFWVKIAYLHSLDMWDEGWFVAIASRMAEGLSDPFLPLYYTGNDNTLQFFDKPPVAFWGGAILMIIFGNSTFAGKGVVILGGTGLALVIYFLYSHQSENRSAAVIGGLLVALGHFLTFYSRTAYIDPFVVFMSALVMLLAIRAVDAIFVENNPKKGYTLLLIVAVVNILNILTKAWQGILTFPAIAIYLVFRYIERHVNLDDLRGIWGSWGKSKDLEPHFFFEIPQFKTRISYPFIIALVTVVCAFIGAVLISGLFVSGLILSIIAAFGFYLVFLRIIVIRKERLEIPGLVSGIVGGLTSGISGGLVVKIFFSRLADSFIAIAQAFGANDVFSGGFFEGVLFPSAEEALSNANLALIGLELIAVIFGAIITFGVVFFISGFLLDLFSNEKSFLRVLIEGLDLIPIVILGAWFVFWFAGILLLGIFFERDAFGITIFGVAISLLFIPLVSIYPKIKNRFTDFFKLGTRLRSADELSIFESHLQFLCIAIILIIISFYPFVAWVQFLDTNIADGTFPWSIRVPGELYSDPQRPNPVTYTFLFFEYYISWRYTHATKYDLASSIGSAVNDYALLVMLPFFVVGIAAFFFSEKRNPALGSALLAWLVTVPFVFFPAQFQLNYYYIPLAIPFYAIAAKGIEFVYSYEKLRITVADNVERLLGGAYFYLDIGLSLIIFPLLTFGTSLLDLVSGNTDLNGFATQLDIFAMYLFAAAIYLVPFTILAFRVLKTFPGIIATGFAYKFFITSWIHDTGFNKLYVFFFHDFLETILKLDFRWIQDVVELGAPLVTLIGIILLLFGLYWLKPKIKPQAFIILALTLSGMLINVSVLAHVNQIFDLRCQEVAAYVKNHGGAYNYSTWVVSEAGMQFAMRYYIGYEVIDDGNAPFSTNSTFGMETYYQTHPNIKFWMVVNNSEHWHVPPLAINYSAAYQWLTTHEHLVCVDDVVGLTPWYKMHLFVNRTWIENHPDGYDWTKLEG